MTTQLISKDTFQAKYSTQLPEQLLESSDWYMTAEGYSVLLEFSDDDNIIEAQQEGQYSYGLDEWLDIEIDRLFKKYNSPDVFPGEAIAELKTAIAKLLGTLDLSTVVIN